LPRGTGVSRRVVGVFVGCPKGGNASLFSHKGRELLALLAWQSATFLPGYRQREPEGRAPARRTSQPNPPRVPGQKGRPRLVGERLPNLTAHRDDTETVWKRLTIARWYSTGFPPVPIRSRPDSRPAAAVHHPAPPKPCSVPTWRLSPNRSSPGFSCAWSSGQLEVTFHEVRAHLGVETRAPVVRPRDRPHHPGSARPLLAGDAARARPVSRENRTSAPSVRLVCHITPHLHRCSRPGAPPAVDPDHFPDIPCRC
jgi:hypothetical protein